MATSNVEAERSDVQLKHLSFVKILAINAAVVVSNLYDYAKHNSGPLKSTVGKVEHAVTAVVGPVYHKFNQVPSVILVFLDNKVDEASHIFAERAPPAAKDVVSKTQSVVKKASVLVQDLAEEAKVDGPIAAISHAARISKEFTVNQLVMVWYKANQYSHLHGALEMAIPTATHLSDKYNSIVKGLTAKGYSLFSYVPLIPVEEMVKAYKQVEAAAVKKAEDTSVSSHKQVEAAAVKKAEDTSVSSHSGSESDNE